MSFFNRIGQKILLPATKTIQQYQANLVRLYEQGASQKRIEHYQRWWMGWVKGGLGDLISPSDLGCIAIGHDTIQGPGR